jgi:selenocysteine lyase/cysteine desulfurase
VEVSTRLAEQGIGVRDGHMYAPRLMQRLKISEHTGAVRASLVHYNTVEEIRRFGSALRRIASQQ